MSNQPVSAPHAPPADDEPDIFCPHCDYNVKGSPDERCPECGSAFDREWLIMWATSRDLPLSFGPSPLPPDDQKSIFAMSLSEPGKLGRNLPPFARRGDARAYGWAMRAAAVVVIAVVCTIATEGEALLPGLLIISPAVILASLACETCVAWLLSRCVEPLAVPRRDAYRFWRNLCACFSTYLPISCAAFPLLAWLLFSTVPDLAFEILANLGLPLLMIIWWWSGLGKAAVARSSPSAGRTAVILLIPVVGVLAVILGYILAKALAFIGFGLLAQAFRGPV